MKKSSAPGGGMSKIDVQSILDDFRGLNPNDVGTWSLIPKFTALFVLFVAILVAGWWFVWDGQLTALEERQQQELRLKEEFLDKKKQAINLDLYTQQLSEIDQTFGALLKQLPNKSEMEALLVEVNQAGLGRGLQFELFKPGQEQIKDFYAELPIVVKITGTYHDVGAFAADIAKLPRIVTLNNIAVVPGSAGRMSLDAVTKTFRYLDQEELAKTKLAAKKGGAK